MICPQCQHENPDDARFCRICGTPLQEGDAEGSHESQSEPGLCPNCGHQNDPSAQFCASCGKALEEVHQESPAEYLAPGGRRPPPLPQGGFTDLVGTTFSMYADHFLPFFLISLLPQLVVVTTTIFFGSLFEEFREGVTEEIGRKLVFFILAVVLQIIVNLLAAGATIHAVGRHFLGLPIHIVGSYAFAFSRFPKLVASVLLIVILLIPVLLLSFILIGIPILVFLVVAWLFISQTIIVEDREPITALGRSWEIVVKYKNWLKTFGNALGLSLMVLGIYYIGGIVLDVPSRIHPIVGWSISVLFGTLFAPVVEIGLTALYFKLRVQTESYNHRRLAGELLQ